MSIIHRRRVRAFDGCLRHHYESVPCPLCAQYLVYYSRKQRNFWAMSVSGPPLNLSLRLCLCVSKELFCKVHWMSKTGDSTMTPPFELLLMIYDKWWGTDMWGCGFIIGFVLGLFFGDDQVFYINVFEFLLHGKLLA